MAVACGALSSAPSLAGSLRSVTCTQLPPSPNDSGLVAVPLARFENLDYKKIVPDPPLHTRAHKGTVLFSTNPGISLQIALTHASLLLKGAELTADDIRSHLNGYDAEQLWSVIHGVEMARSLVESLLVEPRLAE